MHAITRGIRFWTVIALLSAAVALRVYLYAVGSANMPVTTDEAITVLQAEDILRGEFPLLMTGQPYMFPMDAYWMAPVERLLPRTAFGMRSQVLAEGLILALLGLWILRKMGPWREVWPGAILVLFPSAYLLCTHGVYSIFTSAAILVFLAAGCFAMMDPPDGDRRRDGRDNAARDGWLAFAGALCLGLAVTNSLSALGMAVPLGAFALWNTAGLRKLKPLVLRLVGFAAGGFLGLLPHLWTRWTIPNAHQAVTEMYPLSQAWERFWQPTVARVLPGTLGVQPSLWPDSEFRLPGPEWALPLCGGTVLALCAAALLLAAFRIARDARARRWPVLGPFEWALGVMAAGLVLFALNRRATACDFRYLVPVADVVPFLVAGLWQRLGKRALRWIAAAGVACLGAYNATAALRLAREWKADDFAMVMAAPDLAPALDLLRSEGIRHAVASHWAAYRIDFEADGDIVCAQPRNERFAGWPIPYKAEVDASTNVAYVLTDAIRFLKPGLFESHMRTMEVEADATPAGRFRVYRNFRIPETAVYQALPPERFRLDANNAPEKAPAMADGQIATFWRTDVLQTNGIAVECAFDSPVPLAGMRLRYGQFAHDRPRGLGVDVFRGGEWSPVEIGRVVSEPFIWQNGHPVYSDYSTDRVEFPLQEAAEKVRVSIARPNDRMAWTLCEVEPLVRPLPAPALP